MGRISELRKELETLERHESWGAMENVNERLIYAIDKKVAKMPEKNRELHQRGQVKKFLRKMAQYK